MEKESEEVLKDINSNEKEKKNDNNNNKENEEINNDIILMIPEINEIDEKEYEKEFSKPTIPSQSVEEQQKQHLESEEEIRKSNDKITVMKLETENEKKKQQEQQEQQDNKEGYGNDDVTEMVLSSVLYVSQKAIAGAQFVGNIFADIFGFGEGKYQYHIDEYNMIQEEKKRKLAEKALKESNMESQTEPNINNVSISTESPKTTSQQQQQQQEL
ncbi:hypothetical protein DDB_G0267838 [Dictyostelium discoideum AX4]|uniref:Uncharacterized protein n=1 Tax=Dictyostelium discoideum TaxID=44689 RepID=Q55G37_DICDI|nr:hypothetical protein DDB_G0267838 [Dictyostelium discoideum AX4]EAL73372.1 hypothetical protein DDB_G0267838 [Dictyostelium discoideum AX4]|eukprot:XP_647346.1 hypothetical protein DDB_G0267838 [Dictyostelium discoideum AX4]